MQTTKTPHGQKPGLMTRAMSAVQHDARPRVLRIGLVQAGRIVEERTLKANESLRVGSSEKNELLIESTALGATYTLVQVKNGAYTLRVPAELSGRVSDGESVRELQGEECELILSSRSRGRLQIGDAIILFQFVPEAVHGEGAQLPLAARGGFARSIDWVFTSFVLASYMGFFGFVIYLENADWELEPANLVPELAARLVFNEPEPPIEQPQLTPEFNAPDEVVAEAPVEDTRRTEQPDSEPRRTSAPSAETLARNATIRETALRNAQDLMIRAFRDDGQSALEDLLAGGAPTQNADEVLARVAGVETASRRLDELRDRDGGTEGSGTRVGIDQIVRRETEEVRTGPIEETRPRGLATARPPIADSGTGDLDMNHVASTVRRRMSAIRRCYERELNAHPTLAGKVLIEFTVQERGTVTRSHSIENQTGSTRLASCLSTLIGNLRISPGPQGGSVTIQYPFVFALQQQ
ncbi:MAG: hypothetical protein ACI9KE_000027 [Polyangiales bacterium]|jgi:hypothetical protein